MSTVVVFGEVRAYCQLVAHGIEHSLTTTAAVAPGGLEALAAITAPDVEVAVAAGPAGDPSVAEILRWRSPSLTIVALAVGDEDAPAWLQAGANTVLPPSATLDEVLRSVDCALRGEPALLTPSQTAAVLGRLRTDLAQTVGGVRLILTPQEWNVALLVADGLRDKEIAARLHISPATAKSHVRSIRRKLGAHNRVEIGVRVSGERRAYPFSTP
jgi:DNA-binding NarL/FixJ family response regulator